MHSEELADQERSVDLDASARRGTLKWARHHHDIVARFGRFPHRNALLGRETTPEEAGVPGGERLSRDDEAGALTSPLRPAAHRGDAGPRDFDEADHRHQLDEALDLLASCR